MTGRGASAPPCGKVGLSRGAAQDERRSFANASSTATKMPADSAGVAGPAVTITPSSAIGPSAGSLLPSGIGGIGMTDSTSVTRHPSGTAGH